MAHTRLVSVWVASLVGGSLAYTGTVTFRCMVAGDDVIHDVRQDGISLNTATGGCIPCCYCGWNNPGYFDVTMNSGQPLRLGFHVQDSSGGQDTCNTAALMLDCEIINVWDWNDWKVFGQKDDWDFNGGDWSLGNDLFNDGRFVAPGCAGSAAYMPLSYWTSYFHAWSSTWDSKHTWWTFNQQDPFPCSDGYTKNYNGGPCDACPAGKSDSGADYQSVSRCYDCGRGKSASGATTCT